MGPFKALLLILPRPLGLLLLSPVGEKQKLSPLLPHHQALSMPAHTVNAQSMSPTISVVSGQFLMAVLPRIICSSKEVSPDTARGT